MWDFVRYLPPGYEIDLDNTSAFAEMNSQYCDAFEQGPLGRAKLFVKEMAGKISCNPENLVFCEKVNGVWVERSKTVMITLIVSVLQRVLSRVYTYGEETEELKARTIISVKEAEEIMFFVAGILCRGS